MLLELATQTVVASNNTGLSGLPFNKSERWNAANRRRSGRYKLLPFAIAARTEHGAEAAHDEARQAIVTALGEAEEAVFRDHLDYELKEFDKRRKFWLETANRFAPIAGLPSPAWAAVDLDDHEHRLEQYRGKVVVLDFWFRGCNYCIRAMPQVEQSADYFRAAKAPVAFFGVSTDAEQADASFVARELRLSYPVLWSKAVAAAYAIRSFPTFLVIDADGRVQGILCGYSSTLREDLIACIEHLLAKNAGQ